LEKYKKYVGELCNYVTIGLYWGMIEPEKGEKIELDYIRSNLEWATSRGMTIKGHPMIWHQSLPKWLFNMTDPVATDQVIQDHIRYLINHYPEIDHWDVYNEAVAAYRSHVPENGVVRWVTHKGGVNPAVESLFSLANEINPDNLYINNHYTHTHPEFKELNQHLILKGIDFGAIGIQTHMHQKPDILSEKQLWDLLEDYSQFGKSIHLTEVTVLSSEPFKDWKAMQAQEERTREARNQGQLAPLRSSTPEWDQYQADYLRDFYTLAFSHPSVQAIVYWNASDLGAWRGTASGFLDVDNNPKPAYHALRELINEKWNTSIQDKTDKDGTIMFTGYYGDYQGTISINNIDYDFTFTHSSDNTDDLSVQLKE